MGIATIIVLALATPAQEPATQRDHEPAAAPAKLLALELRDSNQKGDSDLAAPAAAPLALELRDSSLPEDWARQVDYELAVSWGPISVAANHHALQRNLAEAQVVASIALAW